MRAWLDSPHDLLAEIETAFYGGAVQTFYLRNADGEKIPCTITDQQEHSQARIYHLCCEKELHADDRLVLFTDKGRQLPVAVRSLVRTPSFQHAYVTDEPLGVTYTPEQSTFRLWAPTAHEVTLVLKNSAGAGIEKYEMERGKCGVFEAVIPGNLEHALYHYRLVRTDGIVETIDPYGLSSTANGTWSAVINESRLVPLRHSVGAEVFSPADAVIYETSIRDFTSLLSADRERGTFRAFADRIVDPASQETGLDKLARLGVTHIQVQPVQDFATVDELDPFGLYNWGYDPRQYFALEGSYSSDAWDPYARMNEFRYLVSRIHEKGMRLIVDVVYNHMYDMGTSSLQECVPWYYFRTADGILSNGSGVGNDLDSTQPMCRRLILDSLLKLIDLYDVDGFRFDLMGILDVETMNEIDTVLHRRKASLLLYGEGWNMPTALAEEQKADLSNQQRMPHIGMFNDRFRDSVKGSTMCLEEKGYLSGDTGKAELFAAVIKGSCDPGSPVCLFDSPLKSINNLETHDNNTLWDKLAVSNREESEEIRRKRLKMMLAAILLSEGVPFLHAGIEFCGTKQGNGNSYLAGDAINGLDWALRLKNRDLADYCAALIALRKQIPGLRLRTVQEVQTRCHTWISADRCVGMDVDEYRIVYNPNAGPHPFDYQNRYELYFDENGLLQHIPQGKGAQPGYTVWVLKKIV